MNGAPVRTTCPYCGVGCGVVVTPRSDGGVEIKGDLDHPANYGRLCSKGSALGETISLEGRLLHPEIGGARADWDTALGRVASAFSRTIERYGPDSVALYVSGQLLTEDYYVANKLMKGFIGSANIDTNSRLCMASSVAGHKRAFGSDTVPGTYRDLELADLVVLVGSNLAWCHPVLFQRLAAAKTERPGMKVVVIDPRATATTELADLHLALRPDSDVALFAGLLHVLDRAGKLDKRFVFQHTTGWGEALRTAEATGVEGAIARTGLPRERIEEFSDCSLKREKPSRSTRRASISLSREPTRSTRLSTAICSPAGSAGREWDRSRSRGSRMRWAVARSAGSRTSSPVTWRSTTKPIARSSVPSGAARGLPTARV